MLTQEKLKYLLNYDEDTGLFTRLVNVGNAKKGTVVGRPNTDGYLRVCIYYKEYLLHRLAFLYMLGSFPIEQVDHINGIRDDNRWINLRDASNGQNKMNSNLPNNNTSGMKGVSYNCHKKRWISQLNCDGKIVHYNQHHTKEAAIARIIEIRAQYHKEFTKL